MKSVSGKYWEEIKSSNRIIQKIKNETNLSEIIAKIILYRNFDQTEILSIENNIELSNPFLNSVDFENCSIILDESIKNKDKILIIGDYDVDGSVSTALMIKFLKKINYPFEFYIPDRIDDGYGASLRLVKKLCQKKPSLIIMVDCGSNSNEAIDFLNQNNIKCIIIDHHEIFKPYPKTKNLINPKKECDYSTLDYFCASALTYFFIDYFIKRRKLNVTFQEELIYVLLATIADVMPLRKINRIIAINVLKNFDVSENVIFKTIFNIKNIKKKLSVSDLGFIIAPIINSSGRIGDSKKGVEVLIDDNEENKKKILNELIHLNEKRKLLETNILKIIDLAKISKDNNDIIILKVNNIHEGLIGIIASKIKDYFNKPVIIFTTSGSFLKGSARSTNNFNIGKYIKVALDKKLIITGGGHNLAAGITLKKNNYVLFKNFLFKVYELNYKKNISKYISKLSMSAINDKFINELKKLEPYGPSNERPYFLFENLTILKTTILKNKFISCLLKSSTDKLIKSISFNLIDSNISKILLNYKKEISIIAQINENLHISKNSAQLTIVDIIINPIKA